MLCVVEIALCSVGSCAKRVEWAVVHEHPDGDVVVWSRILLQRSGGVVCDHLKEGVSGMVVPVAVGICAASALDGVPAYLGLQARTAGKVSGVLVGA